MIGIIGAMQIEVAELKGAMHNAEVKEIAGRSFYTGTLEGKEVVVVQCGVGKANSAMIAQLMIDTFPIDRVINTGVAGSLNNKLDIGDIVLSSDALEHDMDVEALGYAPGVIPGEKKSIFPADPEMIRIAEAACRKANPDISVYVGRVLTGDQFIYSKKKKEWLVSNFDGLCVEMEGGAISHVCWQNKIPYLIIRSISDKADDSSVLDYPVFEEMAVWHTISLLHEMLRNM